jgi:pyrroline-5-carboxylate reductase
MSNNNSSKNSDLSIAILGYGKMGSAIAQALVSKNFNVSIIDKTSHSNYQEFDVCFIATKPQQFDSIDEFPKSKIYISIMAGVSLDNFTEAIKSKLDVPTKAKFIRAMPNIAALVAKSVTVYSSKVLNRSEEIIVKKVLASFGVVEQIEEHKIDAFTALAGSGPAYFALLAQHLQTKAKELGFLEAQAKLFVEETIVGLGELLKTGLSVEKLIEMIASKGGTTEAGLESFSNNKFEDTVSEVVESALSRAVELNSNYDN